MVTNIRWSYQMLNGKINTVYVKFRPLFWRGCLSMNPLSRLTFPKESLPEPWKAAVCRLRQSRVNQHSTGPWDTMILQWERQTQQIQIQRRRRRRRKMTLRLHRVEEEKARSSPLFSAVYFQVSSWQLWGSLVFLCSMERPSLKEVNTTIVMSL